MSPGLVDPGVNQEAKLALTTKRIAKLTEAGRHADGHGLYLQITAPGTRSWLLRYKLADLRPGRQGKRRERWMGLGPLPECCDASEVCWTSPKFRGDVMAKTPLLGTATSNMRCPNRVP